MRQSVVRCPTIPIVKPLPRAFQTHLSYEKMDSEATDNPKKLGSRNSNLSNLQEKKAFES